MAIFTRKLTARSKNSKATLHANLARSPILRLPGEIRNQIYDYATYPSLSSLLVVHGSQAQDFGRTILNLSVLRICHQIRVEALSHMCASKHIQIMGIDVAAAFFDCIGKDAVCKIRALTIAQPIIARTPVPAEQVDKFFDFLKEATALRHFKLEVGQVGELYTFDSKRLSQDWEFLLRVKHWVQETGVEFRWSAGSLDSRAIGLGKMFDRTTEVRELFGKEGEVLLHGIMYLW